ncbi:hypothetical protein [Bosea sp. ANAM02]|uniref:hypothetical protein n=1 Tax=Bosea sp. ANAM02 TaxID=2020412 RepID=UPI00156730FB|nr:hypothetical protein [Bosea sp. ANAM02]
MDLATFYRGIAVSPDRLEPVLSAIKDRGLGVEKLGFWAPDLYRLPEPPRALLQQMPIPRGHLQIEAPIPAVYATADRDTALYYALKHNRNAKSAASILISFQAPLDDVMVDGRDLLYTAASAVPRPDLRALLVKVFGEALLPYLDAAWATSDGLQRITIIDLAVHDPKVIRSHYANRVLFRARNGIPFRSAFVVPTPIPKSRILFAREVDGEPASEEAVDALEMIEMRVGR